MAATVKKSGGGNCQFQPSGGLPGRALCKLATAASALGTRLALAVLGEIEPMGPVAVLEIDDP